VRRLSDLVDMRSPLVLSFPALNQEDVHLLIR